MELKYLRRILAVTILAFTVTLSYSQSDKKPKMLEMEGHYVKSSANGKTYQVFVSLPMGYSQNESETYPVLYQLDGFYSYQIIDGIKGILEVVGETEKTIVVSIADSILSMQVWDRSRWYDFTPGQDAKVDSIRNAQLAVPKGYLQSGGADNFVSIIKNNIMPFIENHYRTNGDNGIAGHSAGGLFATYCLFKHPDLFDRYGLNSPGIAWKNYHIFELEQDYYNSNKELSKKVLISVAENDNPDIVESYKRLRKVLEERNYDKLDVEFIEFTDETHVSVMPASISKTLTVLYGRKKE